MANEILDPAEASSGTKFGLTIAAIVLVSAGAVFATYNESFRGLYFSYGELIISILGVYFTGSVIHKIGAGVVNGKYATTTDEVEITPKPPVTP